MKRFTAILAILGAVLVTRPTYAEILTAIPGPDDQGALQGDGTVGMIMPMVSVSGTTLSLMFMPPYAPELASLSFWSPGDTFQPGAAWYNLLDPVGGQGALFNNQYGFMLMGSQPATGSLAIRLTSTSSSLLQSWNYLNASNRFDLVFQEVGDQVLWSGGMWHNYFTLPSNAAPGTYSATFEIFVANATFTTGTGYVDYTDTAKNATQDTNYNSVTVNYQWTVVPEPTTMLLSLAGLAALVARRRYSRG